MKIYLPTPERLCHCNASLIDPDALAALEEGYLRLRLADVSTPLKKHLPRRVFALLQYRTSPMGASLLDVVQQGMLHHDAPVGAVLPDPSAYETFQLLFDPLLDERHFGFDVDDCQPAVDWGDWSRLRSLDPRRKYIHATAVSACRNLQGFRFTPTIVPEELHKVEDTVLLTLYKLPGIYKGKYEFVSCLPPTRKKQLLEDHCLFTCGDKYDHAANVPRFWSYGRGVFVNKERNFFVWINSRDHMRVISQEKNGDLQTAYRRLMDVMPVLDACLRPVRHDRLGFLTVNLDNLGSGLVLTARMCLPNIPQSVIESITKVYHMETKHIEENIYLISHNGHLGYTEFEVAREFNHGVREVLFMARFYDTKKKKKKRGNDVSDKPEGPDKPGDSPPPGPGGGEGDTGQSEQSETTTQTVTETVTTVETTETSGGGGGGAAPSPQDFIWALPSVVVMRASVSTTASRASAHRLAPTDEAKVASRGTTNLQTPSETEMYSSHNVLTRPKLTFYDDIVDNMEKRKITTPEEDQPAPEPRSSRLSSRSFQPDDLYSDTNRHEATSQDGSEAEVMIAEENARPVPSENISSHRKISREIVTTLSEVFHIEEKSLSTARDSAVADPSATASTAPRRSDSADLFYTGGYLPEEKSARDTSRHRLQRRTSSGRLGSAADLFYKGGPLPEERTLSTRLSATRGKTPSANRVDQDSDVLQEERTRPVISGTATPQRQSSRVYKEAWLPEDRSRFTREYTFRIQKSPAQVQQDSEAAEIPLLGSEYATPQRQTSREQLSRSSGVFIYRNKSKEGSQTSVRDTGIFKTTAPSTAHQHSDSADLFYTGGFLPEEKSKRESPRQATHEKPQSVDRLSNTADLFYKGGTLPEEASLSSPGSAVHIKKPEQRDTQDSDLAGMFYVGGELPEERSRPVTSGPATPQLQSSHSRLSGVFNVGRNKSKEGSLSNLKGTGAVVPPSTASSVPTHSDSADLFYTGGFLPEEKSIAPRNSSPSRPQSVDRFSSTKDMFYKGSRLPEENSLSTPGSAIQNQKSEHRDTQDSDLAGMFYVGGELPEERSRPVTSGSAAPQRQSSHSGLSGVFHVGRNKSKEGSLSNVKGAGAVVPPSTASVPTHSDSADLFYTGGFLPEEKSKAPRLTSPDRFSSATDMFYKGGRLPEESSLSTPGSAIQNQKPQHRDTQDSDLAEMFYLGGELPEERTRPVTSGSLTPQRQSSQSRLSGVFHVGRNKSKEGSLSNVKGAGAVVPPTAASSVPTHSDSADLFYTGGFLPEEKSKAPRHTSPDRFSSATDIFYKGGRLPEESPLSSSGRAIQNQKSEHRDTQDSDLAEMFYVGGELPEERTRPVTSGSLTPQRQSTQSRLSGVFHVGRNKSKEGSLSNIKGSGAVVPPSAASSVPTHSDSADLFYTGGFLPEEKSKAPRHTSPDRPQSVDRFSSATDMFYKGGRLPEESPLSSSGRAIQNQKSDRDTQDSDLAGMFYVGGELPEERTRPVTSGSLTPQRQSSQSRLSGVFHVGRNKSKERSLSNVKGAGAVVPPSAASSVPTHSDSADMFYTGGFLPEEKSKAPRHTSPDRPQSVDRFSSATDMFYKGGRLPEESPLSSSGRAIQNQKSDRDTHDSDLSGMFYVGGELPEERTRPVTSGSLTPQRQSSQSRLSGVFHVDRNKSKEGSLSNVKGAGAVVPPSAALSVPTHSDSADMFYTGGFLPEEKSKASRHTSPDRFSSATDIFYKGGSLPEESPLSISGRAIQNQKSEHRDTQDSDLAGMFYVGGELPEERTRPVTSGSVTPQRQPSREKFSRLSGVFHVGRKKSKEGSLSNVRDAEPPASSTAPKHSDAPELFDFGGLVPEVTSKRDVPRHTSAERPPSADRFSSATDLLHKGGSPPEERLLSTRGSCTQIPEHRQDTTPRAQTSRDTFSNVSGGLPPCRDISKEGSLSYVRDARTAALLAPAIAPKDSGPANLLNPVGSLPDAKIRLEASRPSSSERPPSVDRFSSATDVLHKEPPLTTRESTTSHQPPARRDTRNTETAEKFKSGTLPVEKTGSAHPGDAAPKRQSSREKLSPVSAGFQDARLKSVVGSLSSVREQDAPKRSAASVASEKELKRDAPLRNASSVSSSRVLGETRFRSSNDGSGGLNFNTFPPNIRSTPQRTLDVAARSNENQIGISSSSQLPGSIRNTISQRPSDRTARLFPDNNVLSSGLDMNVENPVINDPSQPSRIQPYTSAIWPQRREILVSYADTPPSSLPGVGVDGARGQAVSPEAEDSSTDETKSSDVKKSKK